MEIYDGGLYAKTLDCETHLSKNPPLFSQPEDHFDMPQDKPDSKSILIHRAEPDDYQAIHRIFSQPRVIWGTLQPPFPSGEVWRKRLAEPPEGTFNLVACVEVIGQLGLHTFTNHPRRRHVGQIGMAICRYVFHGAPEKIEPLTTRSPRKPSAGHPAFRRLSSGAVGRNPRTGWSTARC